MTDLLLQYQWLTTDSGTEFLSMATSMRAEGVSDFKIGEKLRAELASDHSALVLTQLDLRERAAEKFSRASEMLFTRPGLEQSTSEVIARYRAERYLGHQRIVDLCCGLGGDLIALTSLGIPAVAVDRDPVHLFLAEHNARVYQTNSDITPLLMNVEDAPITGLDSVFIDPARRQESGKRTGYQSEPSVEWSVALANKGSAVGIKTAPGIPSNMVPEDWELEMIAVGNDLKEAVLWSPDIAGDFAHHHSVPLRRATVIDQGEVHTIHGSHIDVISTVEPKAGQWLHDVNPAVTNAGLVWELAACIDARLIDTEIGFLVSDRAVSTPFATSWRILEVMPWHEKRIKQALAALDIGPIDIRRRGLAGDVPAITKRLRGKGSNRAIIAMTRVNDSPTAIICSHD